MKSTGILARAGLAISTAVGLWRDRRTTDTGLRALDADFHAAYDRLRTTQAQAAPVLVLFEDTLLLFSRGARTEFAASASATQLLKAAAHVPVGIFVSLQPLARSAEPLDAAARARLSVQQRDQRQALSGLDELDTPARTDVDTVLQMSRDFIAQTLARGRSSEAELSRFAADVGPLLLRLTEHATRLELAALHTAAEVALAGLSATERQQLEVVVAGVHQARARSLPLQYFQKRLAEMPGEERRVSYAESVDNPEQARALVGTRRLDREIALAFFGDAKRLQRDVLGDAAARQLERANLVQVS